MIIKLPHIRSFEPDEWTVYKDLRLRALADAPDAFGSLLANDQEQPDSKWISRLAGSESSWDLPLVAEMDGEPIGMAWGRIEKANPDLANMYQMWVAPGFRNLGVGRMLLHEVIEWARAKNAVEIELGVTIGNSPAERLYVRAGFEPVGIPKPLRQYSRLLCQQMRFTLRNIRL